jgi:hypothetical protein
MANRPVNVQVTDTALGTSRTIIIAPTMGAVSAP